MAVSYSTPIPSTMVDGAATPAYFDYNGRYSFGRQPEAALWALTQLGKSLNKLINENRIIASWEIKPGYYLYKKSILIQDGNKVLKHRFITKNELRVFDEFFGETLN